MRTSVILGAAEEAIKVSVIYERKASGEGLGRSLPTEQSIADGRLVGEEMLRGWEEVCRPISMLGAGPPLGVVPSAQPRQELGQSGRGAIQGADHTHRRGIEGRLKGWRGKSQRPQRAA